MRDHEQATVAILDALAPRAARPRVLERFTLDHKLGALMARHGWKQDLTRQVQAKGYDVLAINLVHGDEIPGVHIVVTAKMATEVSRRTATVGGRPIDQARPAARPFRRR